MRYLVVAAVIFLAVAFCVALFRVIFVVVGRAVDNAIKTSILNDGNDEARAKLLRQLQRKELPDEREE